MPLEVRASKLDCGCLMNRICRPGYYFLLPDYNHLKSMGLYLKLINSSPGYMAIFSDM
jgi:hypothetical protein